MLINDLQIASSEMWGFASLNQISRTTEAKMALYKYLKNFWTKPTEEYIKVRRERMLKWRHEPVTVRIEHPTRLDRARAVGYKAKQGYIVVRQRIERGGRMRPDLKGARRPKHNTQRKDLEKNYQQVAEERAARCFPNMEVLNSYYVEKDGMHYWYEIIMVDKELPEIQVDKNIGWISEPQHRRRVFRGLTAAAKRSRGLWNKGKGAEKVRPSIRAKHRQGK
jgi:large subunit ribosomal protein L15e